VPPEEEYLFWVRKVLESRILTNNGPIHKVLEETLRQRFEVPHLRLMANGTLALQLALRVLGVKGKVITTPYSYVATTSAIMWEGCEPVFVDIRPDTLCIDPEKIEEAITPDTAAILATHVYGIPCDVEAIDAIAKKHGLKVIYDAAHAFDVNYMGRSILEWGDASTLSFHATKLFHTVEGGAVVLHDEKLDHQLRLLRSFGHINDEHFALGINAKMSEVHAAMGMAVLPHMEEVVASRKAVVGRYHTAFRELEMQYPHISERTQHNFGYYPVLMRNGLERERVLKEMAAAGIYGRRYFYPSLDRLPYVNSMVCSESVAAAERAICLPLHSFMAEADVERVVSSFCEVVLSSRSQLSIGVEKAV
jgi:dTDP-4-amino-4,6-dideoxygalactose transaminase